MKTSHINKFSDGPNISGDADNDYHLRNTEEKSSTSSDEYETSKVSIGNRKELVTRYKKKKAGPYGDGENLHEEHSKLLELETSLQSHHTDDSDESDVVEHDVKVCDTCGDAGREDLLAICSRCIDGAEHTYCMKVMVDQVPNGDWLCEECKSEVRKTNRQNSITENLAGKDQASDACKSEVRKTNRQNSFTENLAGKDQASDECKSDRKTNRQNSVTENLAGKDQASDECKSEIRKTNRQNSVTENLAGKDQASDVAVRKVFEKRRAEDLLSSSPNKKQALEMITGSTKDVDRGKLKSIHQSLRGAYLKSSSFSFPNSRSKTKLVDEAVLQRQKSTKERASHDTIAAKEMSKPISFRSTNLGSFGPSGSKVKMLSPKLSHVQDLKSPKYKTERSFEKSNLVKLSSSSAALTPKADRLLSSSRGETTSVSPGSNSEVKPLKNDSKIISGLKSINRLSNISSEAPISLGQINEQLPSSPTRVGTASSSGIINSVEQKFVNNSSKVEISKESVNLDDGIKENTMDGSSNVSSQNNKQTGHSAQGSVGNNGSSVKTSKDVKNRDNKLKDAIEAALLKKPGIYRKNKVSNQPDESSVRTMNYEAALVDRVAHLRNSGSLTPADVPLTERHAKISRSSSVDHSKQSNGNSYMQSMMPPAEEKHLTAGLSSYEDMPLSSLLKNTPIPDHECIWQGSFEINRSGKMAEFWDGLQAHLSTCASPRVFEAVNKLPHKILLNGVSRASAWPTQFENNGVKEDNIAIYFFAKDVESYEKSYQVLLEEMIRGDLALIGSINGVELLIFPSNQLPEKSNRFNMLFFLWGVFRGKKVNSLHQNSTNSEKNCVPQFVSSVSTDKVSLDENAGSLGSVEKDKHVDSESKVNTNIQNSSHEKANGSLSTSGDSVNVVPVISNEIISECHTQNKRLFIDLSEDDDFNGTSQTNTWHDASGQIVEQEGNLSKKQKSDNNGERPNKKPVFALDLNEDISCLVGETDNMVMTKKDVDDNDAASSLSLSLAFSPLDKDDEDNMGKGKGQSGPSTLLFRDMVDKQ